MDKPRVQQKDLKQAIKAKKKPIKVVYISNPVSVKATVSEFKSLVQELTGRDSDVADLSKFVDPDPAAAEAEANRGSSSTDHHVVAASFRPGFGDEELHNQQQQHDPWKSADNSFHMFEEVFDLQGTEDFDPFMPTSPYCDSLLSSIASGASITSGASTSRESV